MHNHFNGYIRFFFVRGFLLFVHIFTAWKNIYPPQAGGACQILLPSPNNNDNNNKNNNNNLYLLTVSIAAG